MSIEELKSEFQKTYGKGDCHVYFSPGRVNLIGEHTDYNGGFVFPCALSFGTYCLIRKNNEKLFRFKSLNQKKSYKLNLDATNTPLPKGNWVNYVIGVIAQFAKDNYLPDCGADLLFWGNVPNGAGLSSSASLEVVTGVAFNGEFEFGIDQISIAKYSQMAEREFAGVMCGIMDQFASALGKKNHAIYLNCDSLEYELVPILLNGVKIVIANTNSPHSLEEGKYNERVAECQAAVEAIIPSKSIATLGELCPKEFSSLQNNIMDETIYRRARHVVSEIERTKQAVKELKNGNINAFGKLMNQSHDSLRDDYEVTGIELDCIVNAARKNKGTIGSRMTGGGFGGSSVSLVKDEYIDEFIESVGKEYQLKTGLIADFYVAEIGDGGKRIE